MSKVECEISELSLGGLDGDGGGDADFSLLVIEQIEDDGS
jgi:hypothetical protein